MNPAESDLIGPRDPSTGNQSGAPENQPLAGAATAPVAASTYGLPSTIVPGTGMVAGLLAGFIIGAADGLRLARLARVDSHGVLSAMVLAACLEGLVGGAVGGATELLIRAARWGRAAGVPRWARAVSCVAVGAAPAMAAAYMTAASRMWANQFLASLMTTIGSIAAGIVAAPFAPVFARAIVAGRGYVLPSVRRRASGSGTLLLAPPIVVAAGLVLFLALGGTSSRREWVATTIAGAVPSLLALGARTRLTRRGSVAAVVLATGLAGVLVVAASARWERDLRFVPMVHVLVLAAILGLACALVPRVVPHLQTSLRSAVTVLLMLAFVMIGSIEAADVEAARRAVSARPGLVRPVMLRLERAINSYGSRRSVLAARGPLESLDAHSGGGAEFTPSRFHRVPDGVPSDLNVLFVSIDTLRADHLGAYGYSKETSPFIDALARESMLFENGWAHAPATRESMAAMATSRWPSSINWVDCIGCESSSPRISPGHRTMGEAFKTNGYFTAAFYAFPYFRRSEGRGYERGIDSYNDERISLHVTEGDPSAAGGSSAAEMSDDVIRSLDQHHQKKFFMWVHYSDPHLAYERHPEVPDFGSDRQGAYDGEIRFTDMHFGRVLSRLRQLGLWDRTAIVVTGDHGEGMGEHGIEAHGNWLYPPITKVPFIVRVPGVPPRRIDTPVGHVDLAPTLLNLARGIPEPTFLGRSMIDLFSGHPSGPRPPLMVFQEVTQDGSFVRAALVTERRQLIWNVSPFDTTECYQLDLGSDGRDQWGTAAGGPECPRLKNSLVRWWSSRAGPTRAGVSVAF